MEGQMSKSDTKGSGLSLLDTVLVVAAVVVGIFVVLWLAHAVLGLVLFLFKIAILVVVIAVIVRVVHLFTRNRD
jgi:fatty acid desaturase